jgi:hypothetical protein
MSRYSTPKISRGDALTPQQANSAADLPDLLDVDGNVDDFINEMYGMAREKM